MNPKATKFVYEENGYTVTLEDGTVIKCGEIVSHGKKRPDDGHYDHVLSFSDGVTVPFVGSSETITVPDISWL